MATPESSAVREIRERYGVPDGVRLRIDDEGVLAFVPGFEVAVRAVASGPDRLPEVPLRGRRALRRLASPEGSLLVRSYAKGGLLRHLRGVDFLGPWRPLKELVLMRRLLALRIPVLDAVGCVVHRAGPRWRGWLLTREVSGAVDLEAWLYGQPSSCGVRRAEVLRRAGRSVREVHDAGVRHGDLHMKNLLLTPAGEVLVLDLDKSSVRDRPLEDDVRLSNLVRLGRSVEKHRMKGLPGSVRDAWRFLEGYAGGRAAAWDWYERVAQRLNHGRVWRHAWWRLSGAARPWQDAQGRPAPGSPAAPPPSMSSSPPPSTSSSSPSDGGSDG